jgi:hypothetical protein
MVKELVKKMSMKNNAKKNIHKQKGGVDPNLDSIRDFAIYADESLANCSI